MDIQKQINLISKLLDELDNYESTLSSLLSKEDSKILDLLHLIEFNKLNTKQCYRVMRELRTCRNSRRTIKNDIELTRIFKEHQNKLLNKDYRQFLLSDIGKTVKAQNNRKYVNRAFTEEEINGLLGGNKND